MLGALAAGLGLLGLAAFWQPPDAREMGLHWQAFLARPDGFAAWRLRSDFRHCPPAQCVAWAGLSEPDVARLTALARTGQPEAIELELILNRMPTEGDIGAEDTVLCCGPVIVAQPRRFLELSRQADLQTTRVVTASQREIDQDYAGYDQDLRARRTALASVTDPSLIAWRDRDLAAIDDAMTRNRKVFEKLNAG